MNFDEYQRHHAKMIEKKRRELLIKDRERKNTLIRLKGRLNKTFKLQFHNIEKVDWALSCRLADDPKTDIIIHGTPNNTHKNRRWRIYLALPWRDHKNNVQENYATWSPDTSGVIRQVNNILRRLNNG